MLDLDFAFFNFIDTEKRGLAYRKFVLDRLAPIFFRPRIARLINLADINVKGCNIVIPLGPNNFQILEKEKQKSVFEKSTDLINEYNLPVLAVDRRLKQQFLKLSNSFPLIFGDNFIKALASVLIRQMLTAKDIKKLVIAGETDKFTDFIERIAEYGVPVSIQSYNPARYELLTYRLLYEKGNAVSNSYFNPENWDKDDLVVMFDPDRRQMGLKTPRSFCIKLGNNCSRLAPELENSLRSNGLEANTYNLAPIMETCLMSEAGILEVCAEQNMPVDINEGKAFIYLEEAGERLGIWDFFLDKPI